MVEVVLHQTLAHYDFSDRRSGVRFEHLKVLFENAPLLPAELYMFLLEKCLVNKHEGLRRDAQKMMVLLFINRTEDACESTIR